MRRDPSSATITASWRVWVASCLVDADNCVQCHANVMTSPLRIGVCKFSEKLQNAYIAGASAVVVVNYDDTEKIYMALPEGGFSVDIPMVIVASSKGEALIDGIVNPATPPGKVRAYLSEDDAAEQALFNQAHL